jgi:uncharacterized protein YndB with AHSA1/START domain
VVVKEIEIDAPPEVVFAYLTDPAKMVQWLGLGAELEPRPGGIFRVDPNGHDVLRGTFVEVVPYSRVVFTWGYEDPSHRVPAGSTLVTIELTPQGAGTRLRLVHSDLPEGPARDGHDQGWTHYLARLAVAAAGGDPGGDRLADPAVRHG